MSGSEPTFPDLNSYHEGHRGLTAAVGTSYAEAARVCLSRHHTPPKSILVSDDGTERKSYQISWNEPSGRERDAWGNEIDATRDGAYCLSLAAAAAHLGLVAIRRAPQGSGSDYYLGPAQSNAGSADGELDLETAIRLEVSGIDNCNEALLLQRMREKLEQARRGKSNLPAIASVIGFSTLRVAFRTMQRCR